MFKLIIARHGETAWNTADIFRGRVNIGLSEAGLKQAEQLGEYLNREKIQAVYCSPLPRAFQTAEAVARRFQIKPQPVDELTDLDFGEWEGKSREEVMTKYKTVYEQWLERPDLVQIPGAESLAEATERSLTAVDRIKAQNQDATVSIITHRVITKILICALLGLDTSHFWNIEHSTCGVTTFVHNGRFFILTRHNDTSFLKSENLF